MPMASVKPSHCLELRADAICGVLKRTIYCHGLPGSPEELAAFGVTLGLEHLHALVRLDRKNDDYEGGLLAAFDALEIRDPIEIVGFSLGAMSAVLLAARRSILVRKLTLVSPAAPLELGDFLPQMAGRPVFAAAQRGGWGLRLVAAFQSVLMAYAPQKLIEVMFRGSPIAERLLLDDPTFRKVVIEGMRACVGPKQAAYRAELRAFVHPWSDTLDGVRCPVEIWQGSLDDWTPPAMAAALQNRLGARASLTILPGLGHYSTLQAVLPRLR